MQCAIHIWDGMTRALFNVMPEKVQLTEIQSDASLDPFDTSKPPHHIFSSFSGVEHRIKTYGNGECYSISLLSAEVSGCTRFRL